MLYQLQSLFSIERGEKMIMFSKCDSVFKHPAMAYLKVLYSSPAGTDKIRIDQGSSLVPWPELKPDIFRFECKSDTLLLS
jgi:hypothetical protein